MLNGKKPNSLEGMMDVYARLSDDINEKRFNKKGKIVQSFLDSYIFNTLESQEVLNEYINNRNIENKKDSIQKKNEKYINKISKKIAKEKQKDTPELYADVSKCDIEDKVKLEHLSRKPASSVQEKENQKRLIFKKAFSR